MGVHIVTVTDLADFSREVHMACWSTQDEAFADGEAVRDRFEADGGDRNEYAVSVDEMEVQTTAVFGDAAYEQLTADEQEELFQMLVDEAGDMSSRDTARNMIDDMDISEMREYLDYEDGE